MWTSLDAGLRPVEVGNARVGWCEPENGLLRIPREDSAKNEGDWTVGITDRTATALERWKEDNGKQNMSEWVEEAVQNASAVSTVTRDDLHHKPERTEDSILDVTVEVGTIVGGTKILADIARRRCTS